MQRVAWCAMSEANCRRLLIANPVSRRFARRSSEVILGSAFCAMVYLNFEIGLGTAIAGNSNANKTNIIVSLKSFLQNGSMLMLPFVATMPTGVWCYLMASGVWSAGQGIAVKSNWVRERVGL